jgi:hypothetical protein
MMREAKRAGGPAVQPCVQLRDVSATVTWRRGAGPGTAPAHTTTRLDICKYFFGVRVVA